MFFTVLIVLVNSIMGGKTALEEKVIDGITNTAELKAARINEFYDRTVANLEVIGRSQMVEQFLGDSMFENKHSIKQFFEECMEHHRYQTISLLTNDYTIQISTSRYNEGNKIDANLLRVAKKATNKIVNSDIYVADKMYLINFFKPVFHENKKVGILSIVVDMDPIYAMIQDSKGLGETGETLLGMEIESGALFLNPLRHDMGAALKRKALFGSEAAKPILESSQGKSGSGKLKDYRGVDVIATWRYIPSFNWGLVTKIDESEALVSIHELRNKMILIAILIFVIGVFLAIKIAETITDPIRNLNNAMKVIGKGDILDQKIKKITEDEIGEMVDQANSLVEFQKSIIEFTQEIGKGNFSFESSHDISNGDLGKELLNMKQSLQTVSDDEHKRNWVTEGLAKFATILRNNNDDLDLLADDIITNLVKYLDANQGGIFIISDDRKNPKMKLEAAYAYDRKKFLEKEFQIGEGLIGQCWQEKDKIFLTEIPQNYINITSGLGTTNPTCILIIPLIINEETYGVIELASFQVFDDYQIEFTEKLANSIASTLSSVKVNLHTSSLLEEAQQMSEELQAQEEELRQNAEEMQATQEEMERAQKELVKKEASLRALFDNSDDTVFAINRDYEITVINAKLKNKYKALGVDLKEGVNILEVIPADKREFWKQRYDRAMAGEKFETIDDVGEGVKARVFHYPTYNENDEIIGVAVVSREVQK